MISVVPKHKFRRFTGAGCFKKVGEPTKAFVFAMHFDIDMPKTSCLIPENARNAAFIVGSSSHVFLVLPMRYISQVVPAVISWVSVNVVDLMFRPTAGHPQPNDAVGKIKPLVDADNNLPRRLGAPSYTSSLCPGSLTDAPTKNARFWVVRKQLANQAIISFSHFATSIASWLGGRGLLLPSAVHSSTYLD